MWRKPVSKTSFQKALLSLIAIGTLVAVAVAGISTASAQVKVNEDPNSPVTDADVPSRNCAGYITYETILNRQRGILVVRTTFDPDGATYLVDFDDSSVRLDGGQVHNPNTFDSFQGYSVTNASPGVITWLLSDSDGEVCTVEATVDLSFVLITPTTTTTTTVAPPTTTTTTATETPTTTTTATETPTTTVATPPAAGSSVEVVVVVVPTAGTTTVPPAAVTDVGVNLYIPSSQYTRNRPFTVTANITNYGTVAITSETLSLLVPEGFKYVSDNSGINPTSRYSSRYRTWNMQWNGISLKPSESFQFEVAIRADNTTGNRILKLIGPNLRQDANSLNGVDRHLMSHRV